MSATKATHSCADVADVAARAAVTEADVLDWIVETERAVAAVDVSDIGRSGGGSSGGGSATPVLEKAISKLEAALDSTLSLSGMLHAADTLLSTRKIYMRLAQGRLYRCLKQIASRKEYGLPLRKQAQQLATRCEQRFLIQARWLRRWGDIAALLPDRQQVEHFVLNAQVVFRGRAFSELPRASWTLLRLLIEKDADDLGPELAPTRWTGPEALEAYALATAPLLAPPSSLAPSPFSSSHGSRASGADSAEWDSGRRGADVCDTPRRALDDGDDDACAMSQATTLSALAEMGLATVAPFHPKAPPKKKKKPAGPAGQENSGPQPPLPQPHNGTASQGASQAQQAPCTQQEDFSQRASGADAGTAVLHPNAARSPPTALSTTKHEAQPTQEEPRGSNRTAAARPAAVRRRTKKTIHRPQSRRALWLCAASALRESQAKFSELLAFLECLGDSTVLRRARAVQRQLSALRLDAVRPSLAPDVRNVTL